MLKFFTGEKYAYIYFIQFFSQHHSCIMALQRQGAKPHLNIKIVFPGMEVSIIKIRWS